MNAFANQDASAFSGAARPGSAPAQHQVDALLAQLQRLERKIHALSRQGAAVFHRGTGCGSSDALRAERVTRIISSRLQRAAHFSPSLFAEPAWDMLLDLYLAYLLGNRVTVSSLCIASNVPSTTALRWLKTLQDEGLAERQSDSFDRRRYFIALTPSAIKGMTNYFDALGDVPPVL